MGTICLRIYPAVMNSIQLRTLDGVPLGEYADCDVGRVLKSGSRPVSSPSSNTPGTNSHLSVTRVWLSSRHFCAEKCGCCGLTETPLNPHRSGAQLESARSPVASLCREGKRGHHRRSFPYAQVFVEKYVTRLRILYISISTQTWMAGKAPNSQETTYA
jgi:hypothetical protein